MEMVPPQKWRASPCFMGGIFSSALWRSLLLCIGAVGLAAAQETYGIMAVAIGNATTFRNEHSSLFENYLSEQVSQALGRSIRFDLTGVGLNDASNTLFDRVQSGAVHFVYAFPNIHACLESEFGLSALATVRKKYTLQGQDYFLNRYGGVIIVR